jgi:glc operon protein GlcG
MTQFVRTTLMFVLATLPFATATDASQGLTLERRVLSLTAARKIIAAAEAAAIARGVGVVIVVVDSSGTIIELARMDTAQVASVNVGTSSTSSRVPPPSSRAAA